MSPRYRVRATEVVPYAPANRSATRDYRLIGRETVGARQLELLVGEIERGAGALAHAHLGIERACYLLEGSAHVEVGREAFELAAGEVCLFPADALHLFRVTRTRAQVLVLYAPPYEEDPARVVRDAAH